MNNENDEIKRILELLTNFKDMRDAKTNEYSAITGTYSDREYQAIVAELVQKMPLLRFNNNPERYLSQMVEVFKIQGKNEMYFDSHFENGMEQNETPDEELKKKLIELIKSLRNKRIIVDPPVDRFDWKRILEKLSSIINSIGNLLINMLKNIRSHRRKSSKNIKGFKEDSSIDYISIKDLFTDDTNIENQGIDNIDKNSIQDLIVIIYMLIIYNQQVQIVDPKLLDDLLAKLNEITKLFDEIEKEQQELEQENDEENEQDDSEQEKDDKNEQDDSEQEKDNENEQDDSEQEKDDKNEQDDSEQEKNDENEKDDSEQETSLVKVGLFSRLAYKIRSKIKGISNNRKTNTKSNLDNNNNNETDINREGNENQHSSNEENEKNTNDETYNEKDEENEQDNYDQEKDEENKNQKKHPVRKIVSGILALGLFSSILGPINLENSSNGEKTEETSDKSGNSNGSGKSNGNGSPYGPNLPNGNSNPNGPNLPNGNGNSNGPNNLPGANPSNTSIGDLLTDTISIPEDHPLVIYSDSFESPPNGSVSGDVKINYVAIHENNEEGVDNHYVGEKTKEDATKEINDCITKESLENAMVHCCNEDGDLGWIPLSTLLEQISQQKGITVEELKEELFGEHSNKEQQINAFRKSLKVDSFETDANTQIHSYGDPNNLIKPNSNKQQNER